MHVQYTFRFRTRFLAVVCATLAVIVTPALLFAHARLVKSSPAANSRLDSPPTALSLSFSERPELRFTILQLLDSAGVAVPLGSIVAAVGDTMGVSAPIPASLAPGRYTVVWRTAAADGHATTGRYSFAVAVPEQVAPASPVPSVVSPPSAPSITTNVVINSAEPTEASRALRWVELMAVLMLAGAVIFRLAVVHDAGLTPEVVAESSDRVKRLAYAALLLFIVATLTRLAAESNLIPDASSDRFNAMMSVARGTRWGYGWTVGACGALVVLIGLAVTRVTLAGWVVAALGVVAIGTGDGLTGHAGASTRYLALSIAVDLAHLLGAGGWLGGLTALLLAGLPSLRSLNTAERIRAGSRLVRSYHRAATDCVLIVVVTAVISAWLRLGSVPALWTSTYGRTLLIKVAFVAVLVGFGWFHWRTAVVAEWDDDTKFRFQRSATLELLVGAIVVGVTAVLVSTALPPR
jgi:methionine-rich copper-binding protein CopC/putative copper export protein